MCAGSGGECSYDRCVFEASLGYTPCLNKYLNSLPKKVKGWVHWLCPGAKCINSHILFFSLPVFLCSNEQNELCKLLEIKEENLLSTIRLRYVQILCLKNKQQTPPDTHTKSPAIVSGFLTGHTTRKVVSTFHWSSQETHLPVRRAEQRVNTCSST